MPAIATSTIPPRRRSRPTLAPGYGTNDPLHVRTEDRPRVRRLSGPFVRSRGAGQFESGKLPTRLAFSGRQSSRLMSMARTTRATVVLGWPVSRRKAATNQTSNHSKRRPSDSCELGFRSRQMP
jgi:hypothetical protein